PACDSVVVILFSCDASSVLLCLLSFPTRTLFRSCVDHFFCIFFLGEDDSDFLQQLKVFIFLACNAEYDFDFVTVKVHAFRNLDEDRKSTRLNSSHVSISYAVSCLITKTEREAMRS